MNVAILEIFTNSAAYPTAGVVHIVAVACAIQPCFYHLHSGQQQMGGSTYNQSSRTGYSNNSEGYSQNSYSYTGADVNATSGYSGYHSGDKQGSSNFSGSRGGQSSRGPPSQYPSSGGFGANH